MSSNMTDEIQVPFTDADNQPIPAEGRTYDVKVTNEGEESIQQITLHDTLCGLYTTVRPPAERSQAEVFAATCVYAGLTTEKEIIAAFPQFTEIRLNEEGKTYSQAFQIINRLRKQSEAARNRKAIETAKESGDLATDSQREFARNLLEPLAKFEANRLRLEIIDLLTMKDPLKADFMDALNRATGYLALVDPDNWDQNRRNRNRPQTTTVPHSSVTVEVGENVTGDDSSTDAPSGDDGEDPF